MLPSTGPLVRGSVSGRLSSARPVPSFRPCDIPLNNAVFVEERRATQRLEPHSDFSYGSSGIDVLGLGQAMVDINATVSEDVLEALEVPQGGRRVLGSIDERSLVLATLGDEDCPTELSAGGSLANSLYAIGQLNKAAESICSTSSRSLAVSMGGSCGDDHLGQFFASQMQGGGVSVDNEDGGPTGTVLVLTDNSGERSFLSYFGDSKDLAVPPSLKQSICQSKLVVIEGYLWEMPGALKAIKEVIQIAHVAGAQVALTCGDAGVVMRHRSEINEVMSLGVDMLFCNKNEALELLEEEEATCSGRDAAAQLGSLVGIAVVTDGPAGSCVGFMGRVYEIDPADAPGGVVVSTNGAGDAFCGGFLFALSHGHAVAVAAKFGSKVAASVVARPVAQLCDEDALELVSHLDLKPSTPFSPAGAFACLLP
eukprot:gene14100-20056_t